MGLCGDRASGWALIQRLVSFKEEEIKVHITEGRPCEDMREKIAMDKQRRGASGN
jgi:hypothetical protein